MVSAAGDGEAERRCALCDHTGRRTDFVRAESVRGQEAERIAREHPGAWPGSGLVCRSCLKRERIQYVLERLEQERGELSAVEAEVARRAGEHVAIAENLEREFERQATRGQRIADAVARVGGSWPFVIGFLIVLALWIALNAALAARAFDPYPFILLNLVLSCLAALQAPIIMMSQKRQAAKDRLDASHDYEVNLKAELEIRVLQETLDELREHRWAELVAQQQEQIRLLTALLDGQGASRDDRAGDG